MDGAQISSQSNEANASYLSVPSAIQNLQYSQAYNYITFNWESPANDGGAPISSYNVYRQFNSESPVLIRSPNITSYTDQMPFMGTYTYLIAAVNSQGEGTLTSIQIIDNFGGTYNAAAPIVINGNDEMAAFLNDVGSGTSGDPYIIQNYELLGFSTAIFFSNVTDYVTIQNCNIANAINGIELDNCSNINILNDNFQNITNAGIYAPNTSGFVSDGINVQHCQFNNCDFGFYLGPGLTDFLAYNNEVQNGSIAVYSQTALGDVRNFDNCNLADITECGFDFSEVGSNSAANNNLQGIQNGTAIAISSGSATFTLNGNQIFDWQEGISISSYTGSENQSQIINGLFINNTQSDLVLQNTQGILIQGNLFVIRTEADPFEISAGNVAYQNFYSNYYWKNPDAIQVGNVYNTPYLLDDISGVSDAAPLINSTYQTIPTFTLPINVSRNGVELDSRLGY